MIRCIVAGSRGFSDFKLLRDRLDFYFQDAIQKGEAIEIVSGCAKGADTLGEEYAKLRGLPVAEFPADWDGLGKKAGHVRNAQMAEYATHCVVFWDGMSRGTGGMIQIAREKGLKLRIVQYEQRV